MIIYNKTWLANQRLQDEVEKDLPRGHITGAEFELIKEQYPVGFYTPNLFVRAGLFILTCVIVLFADSLLSLMASNANIISSFGWFFFLGILSYAGLELMAGGSNHYRSGVDDALLITSGILFYIGFYLLFSGSEYFNTALALLTFIMSLVLSVRFADMLVSVVCACAFFAFIFFGWTMATPAGLSTAPFVMMLVSGMLCFSSRICVARMKFINYKNCFAVVQIASLLSFYAAGNYYIIQTLGDRVKNTINAPVPLGWFFWCWTILLPFVYIALGIRKKDVILLRTGLAIVAAAVLTFRNYYHLLPVDIILTIGGAVLLAIAYVITHYLKTPKHGFTNQETGDAHLMDHLKIESLIVAETFSHAPSAPCNDGVKFGGGDFGGGGSGGGF